MKLPFIQTSLACLAAIVLATGTSTADEILIYKYSSARPWAKYDCYRPDIVSTPALPVIPKNKVFGTYTQTEYWVLNKTTEELVVVDYFSYNDNGAIVKEYYSGPSTALTRYANTYEYDPDDSPIYLPVSGLKYFRGAALNTYNVCFTAGRMEQDSDMGSGYRYSMTEEGNMVGVGKAYTVATGLVFQKVATALTGSFINSSAYEYKFSGGPSDYFRSLYFEPLTTQKLTLDVVATKSANTGVPLIPYAGGTAVSSGSLAYGQRVVELILERLGYDNEAAPVSDL